MKKNLIKDGLIGIVAFVILDALFVAITFTIGEKCVGDICYMIFAESRIGSLLTSLLVWPAAIIQASLWRIVMLAIYYLVVGAIVGLIYRKVKNRNRMVSQ
jgi:hypothetical protein